MARARRTESLSQERGHNNFSRSQESQTEIFGADSSSLEQQRNNDILTVGMNLFSRHDPFAFGKRQKTEKKTRESTFLQHIVNHVKTITYIHDAYASTTCSTKRTVVTIRCPIGTLRLLFHCWNLIRKCQCRNGILVRSRRRSSTSQLRGKERRKCPRRQQIPIC